MFLFPPMEIGFLMNFPIILHLQNHYYMIKKDLLKLYCASKEVHTSRIHCFLPCKAFGVPVKMEGLNKIWDQTKRLRGLVVDVISPPVLTKELVLKILTRKIEHPDEPSLTPIQLAK